MSSQAQQHQTDKGTRAMPTSISAKPFEIDSITDYMAPYLPPHQAALASLSLSASLLHSVSPAHLLASSYLLQRKRHYSASAFAALLTSLAHSSTLYIGNLSFTTREEQLLSTFHLPTLRYPAALHCGLNSLTKQPCGFAFVAFDTAQQAHTTRAVLHTLAVDERTVGIDMDQRFKPGREWGRGKSGGQIRDEVRQGWDKGRGGWGARERRQQQMREMKEQQKSTFKQMGEGHDEREADEEADEEAVGEQQQRAKREHGSYAHAQAMRRAGALQAKATEEAEAADEADPASKRQRVDDTAAQPHDDRSSTADVDSYEGETQPTEEGDGVGADYGEGVEEAAAVDEQKTGDGAVWNDTQQQAEEEEEEAEHGFAGDGAEENDEPQWT